MRKPNEGLSVARLLMVLSSMSPLFILWAIRGENIEAVPEAAFLGFCLFFVVVPNLFLWWRLRLVKKRKDRRELTAGTAEDHREHILVYLFAMLLPFYSVEIESVRGLFAHLAAIGFIAFLFFHLNMHYMNLFWAFRHYRVYTLSPCDDGNPLSGKAPTVLITRRIYVTPGEKISAYRLSQYVYFEPDSDD